MTTCNYCRFQFSGDPEAENLAHDACHRKRARLDGRAPRMLELLRRIEQTCHDGYTCDEVRDLLAEIDDETRSET